MGGIVGFRVEKDVMVPMRDGVTLATDVFVPDDGPSPVLLVRMAYNKNLFEKLSLGLLPNTVGFVEAGYAVVWQDCRGTYGSNGAYTPNVDDAADGTDTVAWICEQPWCDGNVGSFGLSYLGMTQWSTASATRGVEGDRAGGDHRRTTTWRRGTAQEGPVRGPRSSAGRGHGDELRGTCAAVRQGRLRSLMRVAAVQADLDSHLANLPMIDQPLLDGMPWWREWMEHPNRDQFWVDMAPIEHVGEITTPALHIGGWFDFFVDETTRAFSRMRAEAATPEAREGQRLLHRAVGPPATRGGLQGARFGQLGAPPYADLAGHADAVLRLSPARQRQRSTIAHRCGSS